MGRLLIATREVTKCPPYSVALQLATLDLYFLATAMVLHVACGEPACHHQERVKAPPRRRRAGRLCLHVNQGHGVVVGHFISFNSGLALQTPVGVILSNMS